MISLTKFIPEIKIIPNNGIPRNNEELVGFLNKNKDEFINKLSKLYKKDYFDKLYWSDNNFIYVEEYQEVSTVDELNNNGEFLWASLESLTALKYIILKNVKIYCTIL